MGHLRDYEPSNGPLFQDLILPTNHLQNEIMLVIMANYILLVLFGISNTLYADQDVGGGNSTGRRHRRGLYGSEVTGGFCPSECLCLSEIQVDIETEKINSILFNNILGSMQHGQP